MEDCSREKKGEEMKHLEAILSITIGLLLILSTVTAAEAKKVAVIVKDSTSLSELYETKLQRILDEMGFNTTLVDKNVVVNYTDFDLIVIAGRPGNTYFYEQLDDFVKDIPVNDVPTIAIDSRFAYDWGWVGFGGMSTVYYSSSYEQPRIIIKSIHPLTQGYSLEQLVKVHVVSGFTTVAMERTKQN